MYIKEYIDILSNYILKYILQNKFASFANAVPNIKNRVGHALNCTWIPNFFDLWVEVPRGVYGEVGRLLLTSPPNKLRQRGSIMCKIEDIEIAETNVIVHSTISQNGYASETVHIEDSVSIPCYYWCNSCEKKFEITEPQSEREVWESVKAHFAKVEA